MQVFSVEMKGKKFEVVGIADVARKTVHFQAVLNGVPFAQDENYHVVRDLIADAVQLNQPETHAGVC